VSVANALLPAALTGLATALGALPFLFLRELPRRVYDGLLGLGAGLMLAAATLGLLAEALADHGGGRPLGLVVGGFAAGVLLAVAMDRLIPHRHAKGHHAHLGHGPHDDHHDPHDAEARRGLAVVGALTLHRLPEGLAIGAGFAAGGSASHLGLLLAFAVGAQNAIEGAVMAAPLRQGGIGAGRSLSIVTLTGLVVPLAALAGFTLSGVGAALPFILALAGGALIYITSNEIIPESHSHGHEGTASFGVTVGFLATMVLQAILHG